LRIGNTVGAALSNRRVLGASEAGLTARAGAILLVLAVAFVMWPEVVAIPAGLLAAWVGIAFLIRAWKLRRTALDTGDVQDDDTL
jgi:cardiolipin synthase